ncbi:MAG: HAD-IA family hydrolase [Anaerolineae bacterium]|nr:HAD-IA family hydrolase [Anaerolineae bacterium]
MKKHNFDAVIFDLDGVITDTASTHSTAWKQMFDDFLRTHAEKTDSLFHEFTHEQDYLAYVDGKPRYQGVASFLESRGIALPFGEPEDAPTEVTVCGLGNRKNELFNKSIQAGNVHVYQSTVDLMHQLRDAGIRIGVASSSKNAKVVLETVGLLDMIETRVDGVVSAQLGLKGKPQADIFTTACDNLRLYYDRAVIVEDAISGVQAGQNGGFGLVLGVAREDNAHALSINGADIVVEDIAEIDIEKIDRWFVKGLENEKWSIHYSDYRPELEGTRETLLSVGNGFFGTRGALEETFANEHNYPGTYIAGLYNRLDSEVGGRTISNEDFVNAPNWLPITFKVGDGDWFLPHLPGSNESTGDPKGFLRTESDKLLDQKSHLLSEDSWENLSGLGRILKISRRLDFRTGILRREMIVEDAEGHQTKVVSQRLASMENHHLAALRYEITPLNYDGEISIRSMLDGDIINDGVARYRDLNAKHLEAVKEESDGSFSSLLVKTNQSDILIAEAARLFVTAEGNALEPAFEKSQVPARITTAFTVDVERGVPLTVDKLVAIYTSNQEQVDDPFVAAQNALSQINSFDEIRQASENAWTKIWEKIDIQIEGDRVAQKLIRLHLYHTILTASPHNKDLDAGIPARGLSGESYRGHIFWDDLYILPFLNLHFPETVRSALMYRYKRLGLAQEYAQENGFQGAIFPWQSGSDGREETQTLHLNPLSGEWGADHSPLQRHVSLAVIYNIWDYLRVNEDQDFLENFGAEVFLEVCRFWAGKASLNETTERYDISGVMGPDEFHEKYVETHEGGLKNNSYTNILVAWSLRRAFDLLAKMGASAKAVLLEKINLDDEELLRWQDISQRLTIPISDEGILEQFEGYFDLKELDWAYYRQQYGNIHRMDRILKAEGKSPDDYKVAKQADALMAFYVLDEKEIKSLLGALGYAPPEDFLRKNFDYYLRRTSHGSTLSRLVHAYLAHRLGEKQLAWQLYTEALESDYVDIQGGTTKEGIHAGVMTGTVFFAMRAFAGLDLNGDVPTVSPNLPSHWRKMKFNLGFKGKRHHFVVGADKVRINTKG